MKNDEKKVTNKNREKKESDLVTKESFSAVLALFSLVAFFILCTKSLVFGNFGNAVHAFLTGAFGYFAYPLALGGMYFFSMALLGKRLVKNRKVGVCVALAFLFAGLIVHTALTFSWSLDGYLSACFSAGEHFPAATVTGWSGGLLVYALSAVVSKVGAIVCFSVALSLCVYLTTIFAGKGTKTAEKRTKKSYEIPVMQPTPQYTENPVAQPANAAYTQPQTKQRPGVVLSEETTHSSEGAFSPFGTPQTMREDNSAWLERSYDNSREYLFGASPSEHYKKNLIFDPNSNANRRPPVDPFQPIESGYTPSYASAYEDSVNRREEIAPLKIVTDNSSEYRSDSYERETPNERQNDDTPNTSSPFGAYGQYDSPLSVSSMQPIEEEKTIEPMPTYEARDSFLHEEPVSRDRVQEDDRAVFERSNDLFGRENGNDFLSEPENVREEPQTETSPRRHEYMDMFSLKNPNVFGREDRESVLNPDATEHEERGMREDRWESGANPFDSERTDTPFAENDREERSERSALHLFDENKESDPYTLRSDFREERDSSDEFELDRDASLSDRDYMQNDASTSFSDRSADRERIESTFSSAQNVPPPQPKPEAPKKPHIPKPYVRISLDDLDCRDIEPTANEEEVEETKDSILSTLEAFKVADASIASVSFGPTVTRYNVTLPRNIHPRKVVALDQSIAIDLHANGVNIYPVYEEGVVSIEVPNKKRQFVQLGSMLSGDTYVNAKSSSLTFAMGKDVANRKVYGDISKMTHLLVAGSSGSGKSVFLGSLIISLIYKYSPEELRLILIDPKKTEFGLYADLPHLMINEIISDVGKTVQSLNWAIEEMNRRYTLFQEMTRAGTYVVNLEQYNANISQNERLPKIVIIIDELADLMLAAKKDVEDRIQNLTQKARAAGIHVIVATQRPSTDVITGVIKSNLNTRIAFAVASEVDSRVILDKGGAEKLLGKGDFLYTMQGINNPVRVQSAFISPEESQKVVNFIKTHNEAYYDEEVTAYINNTQGSSSGNSGSVGGEKEIEPEYLDALKYVILSGSASISMIQRKCSVGYNKAGRIIEWMAEMGYVSAFDGAKARKTIITKEEFEAKYGPM